MGRRTIVECDRCAAQIPDGRRVYSVKVSDEGIVGAPLSEKLLCSACKRDLDQWLAEPPPRAA